MECIVNVTVWNVNLYWHNVLIIGNWTHSQVCSIMLVKTTQYKASGISSANLLRALEISDLPPAISPELNKCPGSNPVFCFWDVNLEPQGWAALKHLVDNGLEIVPILRYQDSIISEAEVGCQELGFELQWG